VKLELRGMTKRFGDLVANDHIDLVVEGGEICCLLGENGAGKSTLMNVLFGLLRPDEGEILVDDRPVTIRNPKQAMNLGIGMVHQHFMLVPVFTVAENVMLGRERTRFGLLDRGAARTLVRELSDRHGLDVDPDAVVQDLPVGVQQRVEILKALANDAQFLILDEPTAVLTPQEIEELLAVMRSLQAEGRSIVFITHKLKEVKAVADRIVVIRRGAVVGETAPDVSEADLATMMVGRSVDLMADRRGNAAGEVRLRIDGLNVIDDSGHLSVDDVSLEVRSGEVLGVAGVQGNGQSELAEAVLGLIPSTSGRIELDGRDLTGADPRTALRAGIGFIPEDRRRDGFVGVFSVAENLILDRYDDPEFGSGLVMSPGAVTANAVARVEEFDIRTRSTSSPVGDLSGGNQQKVVLAREMSRPLRLLVASQPTRGLDVGSIEFVHTRIAAERDGGAAVLLVSTELDEIVALSDRVAVMYRGRVLGVVGPDTPREVLGLMMAGLSAPEADQQAGALSG